MVGMLDLYGFIWVELIVFPLYFILIKTGSSFERIGSWYYLFFYGIIVGFLLLNSLSGVMFSLLSLCVVFAKYPVVGLHFWLPKVHVEASLIGSMVLAGIILKVAFILSWRLCCSLLVLLIPLLLIIFIIVLGIDGKVIIAYSSVVHMSVGCVIFLFCGFVGVYCRLVHVIVSPVMFYMCYLSYSLYGGRSVKRLLGGFIVLLIFLINMSFPPFGAFLAELWIVSLLDGLMIVCFFLCYYFFSLLLLITLFGSSRMYIASYLFPLVLLSLWIL